MAVAGDHGRAAGQGRDATGNNVQLANWLQEQLTDARKTLPKDSPHLAQVSQSLLQAKTFAEAEPLLRECLAIRAKTQPDDWSTCNTKSMLGGALLGQKKYADAEPLLLAGYEGLKKQEAKIPPQGLVRLTEAIERLVQLYEVTGKKDDAAKWRKELAGASPLLRSSSAVRVIEQLLQTCAQRRRQAGGPGGVQQADANQIQ